MCDKRRKINVYISVCMCVCLKCGFYNYQNKASYWLHNKNMYLLLIHVEGKQEFKVLLSLLLCCC